MGDQVPRFGGGVVTGKAIPGQIRALLENTRFVCSFRSYAVRVIDGFSCGMINTFTILLKQFPDAAVCSRTWDGTD